MNTKKPSQKPVISSKSQEQLRDASSILRKIASDVAFIRDAELPFTIQGLVTDALNQENLSEDSTPSPSCLAVAV